MNLLCKETHQCNENANKYIPSAYRLPLKGEWTGCVSSEASNPKVDGIESEDCKGVMSESTCIDKAGAVVQVPSECCQQLGMADINPGHGVELAEMPEEPDTLVIMPIQLEGPNGGDILHVYLGGMRMWTGDANSPGNWADKSGCQTDGLNGQADGSRGLANALNTLNRAETEVIGHGEGASMYLGPGDAKCLVLEMDSARNHMDMSNRSMDVPSVETDRNKSANTTENISIS